MNYNSTYTSTNSNSGYNPLDKTKREGYNQVKKVAGAGLSSSVGAITTARLETKGTNIGAVSVNSNPAKIETKGDYIGSANVGGSVKPKDTQIAANPKTNSANQISYNDSGRMVDYLYGSNNIKNSMDFLTRNNYPTPQERELNKQFYGEEEERKGLYNRFRTKTNNVLNPKLPNATDRLFLSGFLGDEAEQIEYDRKVSEAKKAKIDLLKQFANTEFAHLLGDTEIYPISVTKAINNDPNAQIKPETALNRKPGEDVEVKKYLNHNWLWRSNPDFEKPDEWVWGLTAIASTNPLTRNPMLHKAVWAAGAEIYLKPNGYTEAARLLKHSLQPNPQNIYEGGSSKLASLIKENQHFKDRINSLIATSHGKPFHSKKGINFGKGNDLYYALNNCTLEVYGREENGIWIISVTVYDTYDYTKVTTCMGDGGLSLGTLANDAAAVSQNIGAITPYKIQVDFTMEWEQ